MTEATPNLPVSKPSSSSDGVLTASKDIFVTSDEAMPIEIMTDLVFEDIGGQEIINISRSDIVNGQNVIYQPIKNLTSLNYQYNPQNIISLQDTSETYFKKFPIILDKKLPINGTGPNNETVYIEESTGNIIINIVNLEEDEQVEVQILNNGSLFNDTIYEVNN
jgi:hypothetical protein